VNVRPGRSIRRRPTQAIRVDNPDHVSMVIHNYRWRLGLAEGEPKYDDLGKRLAEGPVVGLMNLLPGEIH
jgi:hypothetical protein